MAGLCSVLVGSSFIFSHVNELWICGVEVLKVLIAYVEAANKMDYCWR